MLNLHAVNDALDQVITELGKEAKREPEVASAIQVIIAAKRLLVAYSQRMVDTPFKSDSDKHDDGSGEQVEQVFAVDNMQDNLMDKNAQLQTITESESDDAARTFVRTIHPFRNFSDERIIVERDRRSGEPIFTIRFSNSKSLQLLRGWEHEINVHRTWLDGSAVQAGISTNERRAYASFRLVNPPKELFWKQTTKNIHMPVKDYNRFENEGQGFSNASEVFGRQVEKQRKQELERGNRQIERETDARYAATGGDGLCRDDEGQFTDC